MGFSSIAFQAKDASGSDVYHTNVIMSLGEKIAVLCEDAIPANFEKKQIISISKIVDINNKHHFRSDDIFAGNVLEVISNSDEHLMLMSERAKIIDKKTEFNN